LLRWTIAERFWIIRPGTETLVANSEDQLHSVLATLEGCRATLVGSGDLESAQFVALAVLQLRLKLNQISDAELKALCDAVTPEQSAAAKPQDPKSPQGPRRHPLLRLVK
jgi:hypothetical protein